MISKVDYTTRLARYESCDCVSNVNPHPKPLPNVRRSPFLQELFFFFFGMLHEFTVVNTARSTLAWFSFNIRKEEHIQYVLGTESVCC